MNTAYLLIGGNLGNRKVNLENSRSLIEQQCGHIVHNSSIYETAAWGNTNQPSFLNQVLQVETLLSARQLIRKILKIEKTMGRVRQEKLGPRIIDIDILFFNHEIIKLEFLTIPHPEIQNRRFVLMPMVEIAASLVHPVLNKPMSKLLNECMDNLEVTKFIE
jgi:2-amino-4-hydroxy-6-hydroxymethyldihydropteridine diphosphokinase